MLDALNARRVMPGVRLLPLSGHSVMLSYPKLLFAALALCCLLSPAGAQDRQPTRPVIIGEGRGTDGTNCEDTLAVLDLIAQDAEGEGSIIMVSRLGRGEANRNLAWQRMHGLGLYLRATRGVSEERIVMAEGQRISGLAKVEIYFGAKLHAVFHLKRNKEFLKGCAVLAAQSNNGMHPTPHTNSLMIVE